MNVKNYKLRASNGKPIRIATKVILENGQEIKFMDKLSKKEAIRNAELYIQHNPEVLS